MDIEVFMVDIIEDIGDGGCVHSSCVHSSCAHSSCACACAGSGRAGCSKKDFYGVKISKKNLNKVFNEDK